MEFAVLIGRNLVVLQVCFQEGSKSSAVWGVACFRPARQGVEMPGRIVLGRQSWQGSGNHGGSCIKQFVVVDAWQKILTVLVGFPRSI